mmetsp:Transcript_3526/g.6388  ORF Transcript_3526/g.6388 Transcript_3526/m.6388 type:complete len:412 (+) Transcript_3526:90-1325(+)
MVSSRFSHRTGLVGLVFLQAVSTVGGEELLHSEVQVVEACTDVRANIQDDNSNLLQIGRIKIERILDAPPGKDNLVQLIQGNVAAIYSAALSRVHQISNTSTLAFTQAPVIIALLVLLVVSVCIFVCCPALGWVRAKFKHAGSEPLDESRARRLSPRVGYIPARPSPHQSTKFPTSSMPASTNSTLSPYTSAQLPSPGGTWSLSEPARVRSWTAPEQTSQANMKLADKTSMFHASSDLPLHESRFSVLMSDIQDVCNFAGSLTIRGGLSGHALFQAYVPSCATHDHLEIQAFKPGATIRATIRSSLANSDRSSSDKKLDIYGYNGEQYGLLEIQSNGPCIIRRQGRELMTVDGDPEALNLWIKSASGKELASGRVAKQGDVECVDIRVRPEMDTVLALATLLAVLLFCSKG